jgi:outer membrane lipoprotein-sorting protein
MCGAEEYGMKPESMGCRSAEKRGSGRWFRHVGVSMMAVLAFTAVAQAQSADGNLQKVLARLDETAAKFHTAKADVVWENVQTQPIFDKDTQTGSLDVERHKGKVSLALHLKTLDGKPVPKEMVYDGGEFKLYEPLLKQMTIFHTAGKEAQIESFLALGFGGSSAEMQQDWTVSYAGAETIGGVATEKLQLLPRTEATKQNVSKVVLWIDMQNGIAIRQQSFDPSGNYRLVNYTQLHLNSGLPANAFAIRMASGTRVMQR